MHYGRNEYCGVFRRETWHWQAPGPYCKIKALSGSNSAVECDLAKVEVAGSNPVSRSIVVLFPLRPVPLEELGAAGPCRGFSFVENVSCTEVWDRMSQARIHRY